jgi:hypothetical protein
MKKLPLFVYMTLGASLANSACAQDAWLLLFRSDHYAVAKASGNVLENIADLGDLVAYGQSQRAMAFISRGSLNSNTSVLHVVDKGTRQVTKTWPIGARVIAHLAGPIEDLVLNDEDVYFVTIRLGDLNSKGGRLDFNRLRLADGALQTFALPEACHTSRLVGFGGVPLVYAWNSFGIWKFDTSRNALKPLVKVEDLQDIFAAERTVGKSGPANTPQTGPFSSNIAIPGAGVFRISKRGVLQKVLNADLSPVGPGRASVELGFDLESWGEYAQLSSAAYRGSPAIGVVGMRNGNIVFEYLNPTSLTIEWTTTLANSVEQTGVTSVTPDAISYVDPGKAAIEATTPIGTMTLWKLGELDRSADPFHVHILELQGAN